MTETVFVFIKTCDKDNLFFLNFYTTPVLWVGLQHWNMNFSESSGVLVPHDTGWVRWRTPQSEYFDFNSSLFTHPTSYVENSHGHLSGTREFFRR